MKRSPLLRRSPLRRGKPLAPVNAKRRAKRRALAFGEQAEVCRLIPCAVCGPRWALTDYLPEIVLAARQNVRNALAFCRYSEPHHVPSRGAGGTDKDCVPLCTAHHQEFHDVGEATFTERHGVDLRAIARRIHKELQS